MNAQIIAAVTLALACGCSSPDDPRARILDECGPAPTRGAFSWVWLRVDDGGATESANRTALTLFDYHTLTSYLSDVSVWESCVDPSYDPQGPSGAVVWPVPR